MLGNAANNNINNNNKNDSITKAVMTFASLANINDQQAVTNYIVQLQNMNVDDAMDSLIVSIYNRVKSNQISKDQLLSNIQLLFNISPKYTDQKSILDRLNFLKDMNMVNMQIPLAENHRQILDTFDRFNGLTQSRFDSYYTGGLMGYLATNQNLERYHGDLDMFLNEDQLTSLRDIVSTSNEFEFISNMDHKEKNGPEYKVSRKDIPMSIGLFLFSRKPDNSVTLKDYHYDDDSQLLVDERQLSNESTDLMFSNDVRFHNNMPYKMVSLESIYNSKKDARHKDKYDAKKIEPFINKDKEQRIDQAKQFDTFFPGLNASGSVVDKLEQQRKGLTGVHSLNNPNVQRLNNQKKLLLTKPGMTNNRFTSGFINIAIIMSILSFIVGLGIGIAYVALRIMK